MPQTKRWRAVDQTFIARGFDPTEVERYSLVPRGRGTRCVVIEQFFGDWSLRYGMSRTKLMMTIPQIERVLRRLEAPRLRTIVATFRAHSFRRLSCYA